MWQYIFTLVFHVTLVRDYYHYHLLCYSVYSFLICDDCICLTYFWNTLINVEVILCHQQFVYISILGTYFTYCNEFKIFYRFYITLIHKLCTFYLSIYNNCVYYTICLVCTKFPLAYTFARLLCDTYITINYQQLFHIPALCLCICVIVKECHVL